MKTYAFIIIMLSLCLASCKKEGCTDQEAKNYNEDAKIDDGTCSYYVEDFVGNYSVEEIFNSETCGSGTDYYTMTVRYYGASKTQVVIDNFAGGIDNVIANIDRTHIVIPAQYGMFDDDGYKWNISQFGTSDGVLSLDGNNLNFSYYINDSVWDDICGEVFGSVVSTKL